MEKYRKHENNMKYTLNFFSFSAEAFLCSFQRLPKKSINSSREWVRNLLSERRIVLRRKSFRSSFDLSMPRLLLAVFGFIAALFILSAQAQAQSAEPNVTINPHDVLSIKVFQEDDLESKLRVSRDGVIVFPLIGTVRVGGKSPEEAAQLIRTLLAKDYLVNPQVAVTITEYDKRRFSVLGQVQKPGSYDMPDRERLTLLDALAMAGGYTRIADPAKITLKRQKGGAQTVLRLNAKEMAKDNKIATFEIEAGDVITVGESLF
jgi:polysaccharide export outer membrane protein